ncbi:MAG: lysophospholipid acyltransferase family protein [Halochromatium sp.]
MHLPEDMDADPRRNPLAGEGWTFAEGAYVHEGTGPAVLAWSKDARRLLNDWHAYNQLSRTADPGDELVGDLRVAGTVTPGRDDARIAIELDVRGTQYRWELGGGTARLRMRPEALAGEGPEAGWTGPAAVELPRLAAGRPVIVLVPHFVGLELGGTAFTALVHPGMYMYQRIRNPVLDAQVRRARTRFGAIPVERRDDLRGLIRTLKSGVPLFYLPDQDPGRRRGLFVPFCGVPAATVPTLGRIARLANAVVIPTFARFLPSGEGLELCFDPPLADFPSGDAEVDTARMNRVIEARLRSMPAQYFWVHRRFKTRPEGAAPIYPSRRGRRD